MVPSSTLEFNSPILLLQKNITTPKMRLMIDFRNLKKKVSGNKFCLPRINEILDQMGRSKYFSTLDLMSDFHQIPPETNSQKYTALSTNTGYYQYTRLPFRLNINPNNFSA